VDSKDASGVLPERIETDTSLREERDKTDQQLATRSSVIDKDADQVIELARDRADDLLEPVGIAGRLDRHVGDVDGDGPVGLQDLGVGGGVAQELADVDEFAA